MSNFNWGIIVWMVIVGLVCGTIGYFIAPQETTGLSSAEINAKISEAVEQATEVKDTEIERLVGLLEKTENETIEEEEKMLLSGYLIDGLFLGDSLVEDIFSDREISTLFDGKVSFDGDKYDAEETLILKDIELLANENDFEGNVYMTVPEGAIEYKLEFEADLNTSLIDDEETLEFSFLGKEVEISAWDNDAITIFRGTELFVDEGETIDFEGYEIVLISVTDESVYLSVEDSEGNIETKIIDEDKTRTVNNLKIRVEDVFSSGTKSFAELVIGTDIETDVTDGEEYEDDGIWEWKITVNSIGLVLVEDFTEIDLDGDEDFPAIGVDKKLCLPNDYVCIRFNGMAEEETEEYYFELDEKGGKDYVRVKGDFISGIEDFDRIYVNTTGIYDRDLELIDFDEIELGDTDSVLERTGSLIVIEDFEVNYNLDSSNITGNEDYLTDYGILVINPEDSIEDQEFDVFIPEKKLEGSISILNWKTIEEVEDTTEEVTNQTNT